MTPTTYRYTFADTIPLSEVQDTLILALLAAEAVHGSAQVRLDAEYHLDLTGHACEIAGDTIIGRDLNRLFIGFLQREFGADAFRVERVAAESAQPAASR